MNYKTINEQQFLAQYKKQNVKGRPAVDTYIVKEVTRLREDGWTYKAIGEYLGISETSARKYAPSKKVLMKSVK